MGRHQVEVPQLLGELNPRPYEVIQLLLCTSQSAQMQLE